MTIAICTAWHNHLELAADYFPAVAQADETVIVDDGSDPPLDFATVRLADRRGYATANNRGLRQTTADIVVFLNNDIRLGHPDWLDTFRNLDPGTLAGPLRYEPHAAVDGQPLPYIDGWCLAGHRDDLLALDGFDEGYLWPGDFTDNDLCLRARAAGMSLRDVRPALIHKVAQTIGHRKGQQLEDAFHANQDRYQALARNLMGAAV